MDDNRTSSLAEQVATLRSRVGLLEDALRSHGIVVSEGAEPDLKQVFEQPSPPVKPVLTKQPTTPSAPVPAPPLPGVTLSWKAKQPSLESRIVSQWFNRVGILAVLVGMSWFLKLAIDNHWVGPWAGWSSGCLRARGSSLGRSAFSAGGIRPSPTHSRR